MATEKKKTPERDSPEAHQGSVDQIDEFAQQQEAVGKEVDKDAEKDERELRAAKAKLPELTKELQDTIDSELNALGRAYYEYAGLRTISCELGATLEDKSEEIRRQQELLSKVEAAESEATFLSERLARLRDAVRLENAELGSVSMCLAEGTVEHRRLDHELAIVRRQCANVEKEISEQQAQLNTLKSTLAEVQQEVQQEQQRVDYWKQRLGVATQEELTLEIKSLIGQMGENWRAQLLAALGVAGDSSATAAKPMFSFSGLVKTEDGPASSAGYTVVDASTGEALRRGATNKSGEIDFALDRQTAVVILDRDPGRHTTVMGDPIAAASFASSARA